MASDIPTAVRRLCLSFPEAEEFVSHGAPTYRMRGKSFATFTVNHHGDGHVALLVCAMPGAAAAHVAAEPKHYFIPPYVGPRGWLGVELNQGISWKRVAMHAREAYAQVAPRTLVSALPDTIAVASPKKKMSAIEIDPLQAPKAKRALAALRGICLGWPGVSEDAQFGHTVWRVGKRVFVRAYDRDGRMTVCAWVGVPQQSLMTQDARYTVPPYFGHQGWIALDVSGGLNADEVRGLVEQSYRHFGPKRGAR